jgi:hypothetical protein
MTQADLLGKNQDTYTELSANRNNRRDSNQSVEQQVPTRPPTNFGTAQFPDLTGSSTLSEQSPIRPMKYFATDRYFVNC